MNSDYVFSLSHLRKNYGQKTVLDDINLAFLRGARIGVIGHNGSGKSTLLRALLGDSAVTRTGSWNLPATERIAYLDQAAAIKALSRSRLPREEWIASLA